MAGNTITLDNHGVAANNRWNGAFTVLPGGLTTTSVRVTRVAGQQPNSNAVAPRPTATKSVDRPPAATNVGDILLPGWFTDLQGVVFNDLNGDGIRQDNEPGIPDFGLSERTRGNSVQDQGAQFAVTNDAGEYDLSQGYPLGQFLIAEAYNPRFKNTGFTYTTDNDLNPDGSRVKHTVNSAQVDVDFLPVIGLSGTLDWGVQAYGTGTDYWSGDGVTPAPKNENGAIVGTVTYDVTRNEFDPAFSAQEDYQPGVSGISMQLWKTHKDANGNLVKTGSGAVAQYGVGDCLRDDTLRGTNAVLAGQACKPFDYYVTESWTRPTGCTALDVNGNELAGEMALPAHLPKAAVDYSHTDPNQPGCIEAPMSGFQIGGEGTVDGNYALTSLMTPESLAGAPASGPALEDFYADAQNNPDVSDTDHLWRLRRRGGQPGRHRQHTDDDRSDRWWLHRRRRGQAPLQVHRRDGDQRHERRHLRPQPGLRVHRPARRRRLSASRSTRRRRSATTGTRWAPARLLCAPAPCGRCPLNTRGSELGRSQPRPLQRRRQPLRRSHGSGVRRQGRHGGRWPLDARRVLHVHRRADPGEVLRSGQRRPQRADRSSQHHARRGRPGLQRAGRRLRRERQLEV